MMRFLDMFNTWVSIMHEPKSKQLIYWALHAGCRARSCCSVQRTLHASARTICMRRLQTSWAGTMRSCLPQQSWSSCAPLYSIGSI